MRGRLIANLLVLGLAIAPVVAETGTWNTGDGEWNPAVTAPWVDGLVPQQAGDVAVFPADNHTVNRAYTVTAPIAIGGMVLQSDTTNRDRTFSTSGTGLLTFDNNGLGAFVNIAGGRDVFFSGVTLADN